MNRLRLNRYFSPDSACGTMALICRHFRIGNIAMPSPVARHSTALNAANLLALPQRFGCPVLGL